MAYDSVNAEVRREVQQSGIAGAASATMAKFLFFQKSKLKKVHVLVTTAGTHASAGVDILVGTTSVGAVTIGTEAAGYVASSALLDAAIPASGVVEIKGKANSATAVVSVSIEHEVDHDAVKS
jgi:hypothetical protein